MNKTQELPFEAGKIYTNFRGEDELWLNLPDEPFEEIIIDLNKGSIFLVLEIVIIKNRAMYHLKIMTLDKTQRVGWLIDVDPVNFEKFFEKIEP